MELDRVLSVIVASLAAVALVPGSPLAAQASEEGEGAAPTGEACGSERHRDFDFWLGQWEVTAGDSLVGHNTIRRVAGGCGLVESWRSTAGGTGTSVNFYDPTDGRWHQTWVGSGGSVLRLDGALRDGSMVLGGEREGGDGGTVIDRITWTPLEGGRVRQHWEVSGDGGESWRTVFDGYYRPR